MLLVIFMLAAIATFALAASGVRTRPLSVVLAAVLLMGVALVLSRSQSASGALRTAGERPGVPTDEELAQTRRTPASTLVPTRPPYATQTPIVS